MTAHIKQCIAEGEAAGWSGAALQRLVVDPRSATLAGFRAYLAECGDIRGLIKIAGSSIRSAGHTPEGAAEHFVAHGHSYESVRLDTCRIMAAADEALTIDTTQRAKTRSDPYAARAAEIDAHNSKAGSA